MSWASAMSDLANSWKVGIAFIILVGLRLLLTSSLAFLAQARDSVLQGIASLLGNNEHSASSDAQGAAGEGAPTQTPSEGIRHSILEFVDSGLIALVLVFMIIRPFVVQAFYIPTGSMKPTLLEDDKILVNKFIYRFRPPQRGDVVVFKAPPQAAPDEKDYIKRLVALPGDTVEIRRGDGVYVNGKRLEVREDEHGNIWEEVYTAPGEPKREHLVRDETIHYNDMPPVTVEPGKVFVMGDNHNDSNDSHQWGQLDQSRIRGKAMFIFWPPSRIGLVR